VFRNDVSVLQRTTKNKVVKWIHHTITQLTVRISGRKQNLFQVTV